MRSLYAMKAEDDFVRIEPGGVDKDKNHGWYPKTQKAADVLLERVLKP